MLLYKHKPVFILGFLLCRIIIKNGNSYTPYRLASYNQGHIISVIEDLWLMEYTYISATVLYMCAE